MEEGTVAFAISIEQAVEEEFRKYAKYLKYEIDPEDIDCLW